MGTADRAWQAVWFILGGLGLFVLVLATAQSNGVIVFSGSVTDLATILFTAATLVLTAVAIILAVLGFWGYSELRSSVIAAAAEKSERVATDTARKVARTVATRTILEAPNEDTLSAQEANEIAQSQSET